MTDSPRLVMAPVPADGIELAVWEWPGDDPPLLFAHATGFHGRCWDQIARRFPSQRRLALDFRGHGRSSKPDPPYPWTWFAHDLTAVAEALDVRGAIGVGHSMGGHSIVAAAIQRPATFGSLVLIDPTIFSLDRYGGPPFDGSFVLRRRAVFDSPEEMWERFRGRPPFSRWEPEVLRDYCQFALLPSDGRFVLACPPAVEASIYQHSTDPRSNLYPGIPSLEQPTLVMRAGMVAARGVSDLNASPTAPDLAGRFPNGRDLLLVQHSHYIPMESPELVAEWIGKFVS
jgi:pimeloyl-ACP methyl ester carboxylesterase